MREIVLAAVGGPENFVLREAPLPAPAHGHVRIRNTAVGVNFVDIYQRTGLYPVDIPAVLGGEGVGVVSAAGEGAPFRTGERVAYLSGSGAYADETIVDAARVARLPEGVSDEIAAAAFLKGLTVEMLVGDVFPLKRGHLVLVTAAAGGVGSLLCQRARHIGARVIAIVGDASKIAAAKANGAGEVIDRRATPDTASAVRALTGGRGVDVVYDSVGAATFESSLDSLAMRGMMVTYGNASGVVPPVAPIELTRRGSLTLARPSLFHYATPDRLPAMAETLFGLLADGTLRPTIAARFPLAAVADAHRLLEGGKTVGAIILTP